MARKKGFIASAPALEEVGVRARRGRPPAETRLKLPALALDQDEVIRERISIPPPKFRICELRIEGAAPYVQNKFSRKAIDIIIGTQKAGSQAKGKKVREPKDFDAVYEGAIHKTKEGWAGIPAGAFRNAMISACRTVGYKMTHAKLAAFVLEDGYDLDDETPLIRIHGEPIRHTAYARNDNGSVDIRVRPMWKKWHAHVRIRYDSDMFSERDIVNLMMRVGQQVGLGEGRPDSKNSAGMGWGLFDIAEEVTDVAVAA